MNENLKIENDLPGGNVPEEDKEGRMEIVCIWYGKDLGEKEGGNGTTHGICPECLKTEMEKIKKL